VQGVDEVGVKELADGADPAAEPDILALPGIAGLIEDRPLTWPNASPAGLLCTVGATGFEPATP
jgi:hypothetical protein